MYSRGRAKFWEPKKPFFRVGMESMSYLINYGQKKVHK